jgi:hypothetical protein
LNKVYLLILFVFSAQAQKCPKGIINSIGLDGVNSLTGDLVQYTKGKSASKCIDRIDPQKI